MRLLHLTETQCKFNTKIKIYGSTKNICTFSSKIFNPYNVELEDKYKAKSKRSNFKKNNSNSSRSDSIKRAKEKCFDIAYSNQFQYFITLTLDKNIISRDECPVIIKKLNKWLNNCVNRKNLKYILIPEFHHDGKSIHFHGLISGDFKFIDSGHLTKNKQTIFNIADWRYGFSTAIKLDSNYENVSKYITKYITKGNDKIFGRFYFSGGSLKREVPTIYCNLDFLSIERPCIEVVEKVLYVKYQRITDL